MIRRWLALTYYLYALRLAALSHFYFNRLYFVAVCVFRLPENTLPYAPPCNTSRITDTVSPLCGRVSISRQPYLAYTACTSGV